MNNWDRINKGFDVLLKVLVKYEVHELAAEYGVQSWWCEGVEPILSSDQRRNSSHAETDEGRILALDVAMVLDIIDRRWGEVFRKKLPRDCRTWANELKGFRIKAAHRGVKDISDDDAYRALDTMQRLCSELDIEKAEPLRALMREVRYGSAEGSANVKASELDGVTRKKTSTAALSIGNLPSWREVITPHPDVAEGRYRKAEFAADLAQVARHTAVAEYQDPIEFFSRTYMTAGIKGLLNQALKRVSGQDGEPVIQLKTAFGGGKTHSMLALYHLLRGGFDVSKVPAVRKVLSDAGLDSVPSARVAVIVGTALDPSKSHRPQTMPGITVNTVWGEIAFQLAETANDPSLYDYVKDADKRHVSPGSEALTALLDAAGPCLVLIDEFVAYAKKLYGVDGLPAGSFDNLITFVQELTEAARASKAMRARTNRRLMRAGVTMIDPDATYVESDVQVGAGTRIYPGCVLEAGTVVGRNCKLLPHCRLHGAKIGDRVTIENSVVLEAEVADDTTVGPFAYLRPGTRVGSGCRVGDFVELKNSSIGDGTKVSHLTYVGDSDLGRDINLGCGVVFVNYDGKVKRRSTVEDHAFIGCNVNLVAPVHVGKDAYIAAGSTVTRDVPDGALCVARERETVKEGWVQARKEQGKL